MDREKSLCVRENLMSLNSWGEDALKTNQKRNRKVFPILWYRRLSQLIMLDFPVSMYFFNYYFPTLFGHLCFEILSISIIYCLIMCQSFPIVVGTTCPVACHYIIVSCRMVTEHICCVLAHCCLIWWMYVPFGSNLLHFNCLLCKLTRCPISYYLTNKTTEISDSLQMFTAVISTFPKLQFPKLQQTYATHSPFDLILHSIHWKFNKNHKIRWLSIVVWRYFWWRDAKILLINIYPLVFLSLLT